MFEAFDNAAEKLVSRIRTSALAEAQAAAQMLTAIDELYRLRLRESGDRQPWVVDTVEAVAGEVAAALRISHGLARNHVWHAQAMRERLPKTAELFSAGDIDFLMFRTLVSRNRLDHR